MQISTNKPLAEANNKLLYIISAVLLPFILVCGTRSYLKISIAGIFLTPFRVFVPLIALLFFADNYREISCRLKQLAKGKITDRYLFYFYCVLSFWIVWGLLSIVISRYSVPSDGLKEILALSLAGFTVFNVVVLCRRGCWEWLITGLKLAVVLSIMLGVYEILTGTHLSTSRYSDPAFLESVYGLTGAAATNSRWYAATGFFYNENDYMAFLVILSPLFAADIQEKSVIKKILGCLFLGAVFFIIYINDAFICLIASLICIVCYLIFSRPDKLSLLLTAASLIAARIIASFVSDNLLEAAVFDQIDNLEGGYGSMYYRFHTYIVTMRETLTTTKGLGFGAGSFTNYFHPMAETEHILSSPHCFWLEIFSQYGIIVFSIFVIFLIAIYVKLLKDIIKIDREKTSLVLGMGTALVFASIAPSGFLEHTYYWVAIALAVYLIDFYAGRQNAQ